MVESITFWTGQWKVEHGQCPRPADPNAGPKVLANMGGGGWRHGFLSLLPATVLRDLFVCRSFRHNEPSSAACLNVNCMNLAWKCIEVKALRARNRMKVQNWASTAFSLSGVAVLFAGLSMAMACLHARGHVQANGAQLEYAEPLRINPFLLARCCTKSWSTHVSPQKSAVSTRVTAQLRFELFLQQFLSASV